MSIIHQNISSLIAVRRVASLQLLLGVWGHLLVLLQILGLILAFKNIMAVLFRRHPGWFHLRSVLLLNWSVPALLVLHWLNRLRLSHWGFAWNRGSGDIQSGICLLIDVGSDWGLNGLSVSLVWVVFLFIYFIHGWLGSHRCRRLVDCLLLIGEWSANNSVLLLNRYFLLHLSGLRVGWLSLFCLFVDDILGLHELFLLFYLFLWVTDLIAIVPILLFWIHLGFIDYFRSVGFYLPWVGLRWWPFWFFHYNLAIVFWFGQLIL